MNNSANITLLGQARFASPIRHSVSDEARVSLHIVRTPGVTPPKDLLFELAGPRKKLFFDSKNTRVGIVTCGGLCPGMNTVIRSAFRELHLVYGVKKVLGFRDGYQGLDPSHGLMPLVLTADFVDDIHKEGGTVLGTSRGPVDIGVAVDNLIKRGVNILLVVGGDGTQRGGHELFREAQKRGHALAVVHSEDR